MNTTEIGRLGESAVCSWLKAHGSHIVRNNFCIRGGEIDIIAQNEEYLAFVEVKTRRKNSMISGLEAVTKKKQIRLIRTAAVWWGQNPCELQPRFDVACVTIQGHQVLSIDYLENAFDVTGCGVIF